MRYILMSRNSIDGFLAGSFEFPPGLYYRRAGEGDRHELTHHMHEAKAWKFEEAARDFGQQTYGLDFFNENWMIVCVHNDAIRASEDIHNRIEAHKETRLYEAAKRMRNRTT